MTKQNLTKACLTKVLINLSVVSSTRSENMFQTFQWLPEVDPLLSDSGIPKTTNAAS